MNKEAEFAIRRMATDLAPTTKSGFVRAMLPAIEEALNAGHTIKAIWDRLRVQTPSLSYKEFCVYIRRIQKRAVRMQTAPHVGRKSEAEVGKPGKAIRRPSNSFAAACRRPMRAASGILPALPSVRPSRG